MSKPIGYYQDQHGMHPIFPASDHNHDSLYLGITAKAADSDKLDNHDTSYFATAGHNHDATYLGITAKAADSDKLDNHDTSYFATAGHNHSGVYLPIAGKAADSEKVDGINGASLIRSDADDNVSAHTEWQDNKHVRFGNQADFRMYFNGSAMYMRGYCHGAPLYIQGENAGGTNKAMIYADPDNAVTLHYAGSSKLATSSTGVAITGTLTVTSTTKVTNLNADLLDGYHAQVAAGGNTIVQRHSSGYIYANYFNTTPNNVGAVTPTAVCVETSNDGFIRHQTVANLAAALAPHLSGGWEAVTNPGTGYIASKTTGWTTDSFSGGLTVNFSAVVPAGTKAVGIVIRMTATQSYIFWRKYNDGNISNTPFASQEFSHMIRDDGLQEWCAATIYLSNDYKAQFAVTNGQTDLQISYPFAYLL